jgi:hypothetical protein
MKRADAITVSDVRRKLAPVVRSITERLNDPAVRDITGCGVKYTDYNTGRERTGVVTAMAFDLRTACWVCLMQELPDGKSVRRKYGSVEVVLTPSEMEINEKTQEKWA